uniref:Uncharacterized protein n=1 Tax=Rhizobium rhizogenes TaxID=359 RepID=A0A7S4ZSB2_RHIRH|nr:hypothetical protein [Rhizobium rhizogenes]QCL10203.1 hypothetical protein pC6.5b_309 [Rhizobium rhizogenes]
MTDDAVKAAIGISWRPAREGVVSAICLSKTENDLVSKRFEQQSCRFRLVSDDVYGIAFTNFAGNLQPLIKAMDCPFSKGLIALVPGELVERETSRAVFAQADMGDVYDNGVSDIGHIRTHFSQTDN